MSAAVERQSLLLLAGATGLCTWAVIQVGPLFEFGEIQPLTLGVYAFTAICTLRFTGECFLALASGLEWFSARSGTGKSGTARWAKHKELKSEFCPKDAGPFWGMSAIARKKLFIDTASNAYVVGPSGSGKGHTAVVPMIFTISHSKVIMDFKPELLTICKRGLEQRGQRVIGLNPFGMYTDIVGPSDCLNVLDVITDSLNTPNGLRNVLGDARELTLQLYEDPQGGAGDDQFWRNGTRKIIALVCMIECMMQGYKAALSDVALLLDDRDALEIRLRSIAGVDFEDKPDPEGPHMFELSDWADHHEEAELEIFLKTVRARTRSLLKTMSESAKTFGSFLEGAHQALEPYGFGQLSSAMGRSSFNIDDLKCGDCALNIFIVGDASRSDATEKFFGLMQWYLQLKLKRHPNKDVPVYLINDEASNYSIFGLVSLMTWGRSFSIRTIQYFQNFTSYTEKHGSNAVEVLNSESEVKLFLPGQRSVPTIKKIVEILGEQSLMVAGLSPANSNEGIKENMSESGRPLMTEDEVRRTQHGILIVRQQRPILQTPVSYSEIVPLRTLADNNPHHGKAFLKPVKLKLKLPKH